MNETYAVVVHKDGHALRLQVNARTGNCIDHVPLKAHAPDYEAARAEAQKMYPTRTIIVPRLGEKVTS